MDKKLFTLPVVKTEALNKIFNVVFLVTKILSGGFEESFLSGFFSFCNNNQQITETLAICCFNHISIITQSSIQVCTNYMTRQDNLRCLSRQWVGMPMVTGSSSGVEDPSSANELLIVPLQCPDYKQQWKRELTTPLQCE